MKTKNAIAQNRTAVRYRHLLSRQATIEVDVLYTGRYEGCATENSEVVYHGRI